MNAEARACIYIISERETDSLENHISGALIERPIGYVETEAQALAAIREGGLLPVSLWPPIKAGTPRRKATPLMSMAVTAQSPVGSER